LRSGAGDARARASDSEDTNDQRQSGGYHRASSGIGEAPAKLLASKGAKLALGARREDELKRIVDEIKTNGVNRLGPLDAVIHKRRPARLRKVGQGRSGRYTSARQSR